MVKERGKKSPSPDGIHMAHYWEYDKLKTEKAIFSASIIMSSPWTTTEAMLKKRRLKQKALDDSYCMI